MKKDPRTGRERLKEGRGRRHAGGEGERRLAAFYRGERRLEAILGGIPFALVEPAMQRLGIRSVKKGRGEMNRRSDCAGLPVGLPSGVHGEGLETHAGSLARSARRGGVAGEGW